MSVPDTQVFTPGPEEGPDGQDALFLGPLMSDKVQKDDLIRFIQGKYQECLQHLDDPDQQKSYFFWMIVEHFCNGNGRVMMAEIAVLLFKGYGCVRRKLGRVQNQEDWCLPLARLLCSTATGDEHRKAIIKMGDDLGSRGRIYASHICYVVAQVVLGSRRRFHIIGYDWVINHHSVSKEVMERTEIYEYVLSLTSGIGQPQFQELKYLYACDLVDAGLSAQALAYCESIARNIFTFPRLINSYVMERVIMLSYRLLQGMEEEEAEWLLKLCRLYRAFSAHSHFYGDVMESISCSYESQEFQEELDSRYTVGKLLGEGDCTTVYAGVRKADGLQVAMKYVFKVDEDLLYGEKPREVALMEMVSKPPRCENVVELLEWIDMSTFFILVLERPVHCMDLQKFCEGKKDGRLSERLSRAIMLQVFRAAHHCFKRGVLHGDIHNQNILINPDTLEVKLIDFGCGEFLSGNTNTMCEGLTSYIWNLGALIVEMITGDVFFYDEKHMTKWSMLVSEECCHLISWCLKNPHNQPTFEEILSHKWFTMELQDTEQEST
ncbi:uncharacterized protein LOC108276327 isoform X2 [Ictalurus punctatus]|uniref:non-specific serine/threonine protein kinase n=1 Tax=Ictalurus punctatus TaxID=7998 RepID=A0A979F833_ICTPU|nr:uncharacterized protein LOC108276327 isoform X2 [Ictalurus punctatus]